MKISNIPKPKRYHLCRLLLVLISVLSLSLLTACSSKDEVTLLLLLRDKIPYNEHYVNSAKLAIQEYADNTQNPKNVNLISLPYNPDSPTLSEDYLESLEKYQPDIVIGSIISGDVVKMNTAIQEGGVPFITMGTATTLTDQNNKFILRASASDRIMNQVSVKYAVEVLEAKRIGLLYCESVFGQGALKDIESALRKYGQNLDYVQSYSPDITKEELAEVYDAINKSALDLTILWPDFGQFELFYDAMKITPLMSRFMGNQGFLSINDLEDYPLNIDDNYVLAHYLYIPDNTLFSDSMEANFGKRPLIKETPIIYDIVNHILFATSLVRDDINPQSLMAALKQDPYQGLMGLYHYKESGDGVFQVFIGQITGGNVVFRKIEVLE